MKSTLSYLVILVSFPFVAKRFGARRELLFLTIPPLVFLGISMLSHLNLGIRHILPIFPFLILLAGSAAYTLAMRSRLAMSVVGIVTVAHAASSLHAYPNYLTYSNEVVGGPSKSYRFMSEANVDWSQGLTQAATYLADRHVTDCWIANRIDAGLYGLPCKRLADGLRFRRGLIPSFPPTVQGTILISANEAAGQAWGPGELNPYRQFFDREPDDIIANSILVFHGTFDVSRASAVNHAAIAQRLLTEKRRAEALAEVQAAAQTFPTSAEVQAILCQVLKQVNREVEGRQACERALSIARRVYPEYQFLRVPAVRALAVSN
jgi:hypothetical protein